MVLPKCCWGLTRPEDNGLCVFQSLSAGRRVSKEDWIEWLRKLSIELLKESPSPALRSCWALAQSYNQLARWVPGVYLVKAFPPTHLPPVFVLLGPGTELQPAGQVGTWSLPGEGLPPYPPPSSLCFAGPWHRATTSWPGGYLEFTWWRPSPLPTSLQSLFCWALAQSYNQLARWVPGVYLVKAFPPTHLPPVFVLLGPGTELQPAGQVGTWSLPGEGLPPYPPPSNLCFAGPWHRATTSWPGGYLEFTWWRPSPLPTSLQSLFCWALAQSYNQLARWVPGVYLVKAFPPTHLPPVFVLLGPGTELQPAGQVGTWSLPGEGLPPYPPPSSLCFAGPWHRATTSWPGGYLEFTWWRPSPLPTSLQSLSCWALAQSYNQLARWVPGVYLVKAFPPTHLPPVFVLLGPGTELQPAGQVGTWSLPGEGLPPYPPPSSLCFAGPWHRATTSWPGGYLEFTWWRPSPLPTSLQSLFCWALAQSYNQLARWVPGVYLVKAFPPTHLPPVFVLLGPGTELQPAGQVGTWSLPGEGLPPYPPPSSLCFAGPWHRATTSWPGGYLEFTWWRPSPLPTSLQSLFCWALAQSYNQLARWVPGVYLVKAFPPTHLPPVFVFLAQSCWPGGYLEFTWWRPSPLPTSLQSLFCWALAQSYSQLARWVPGVYLVKAFPPTHLPPVFVLLGPGTELQPAGQVGTWSLPGEGLPPYPPPSSLCFAGPWHLQPAGTELQSLFCWALARAGQVGTWSLPGEGLPPYPPPSNLCFAGPWHRATTSWPGGYLEFTWWRPSPLPTSLQSLFCWALAQSYNQLARWVPGVYLVKAFPPTHLPPIFVLLGLGKELQPTGQVGTWSLPGEGLPLPTSLQSLFCWALAQSYNQLARWVPGVYLVKAFPPTHLPPIFVLLGPGGTELQPAGQVGTWSLPGEGLPPYPPPSNLCFAGTELQPTGQVGWSLPGEGLPPYPPPSNLCFAGPWHRATTSWPGGYLEFTWWRPSPLPTSLQSLFCWALAKSYSQLARWVPGVYLVKAFPPTHLPPVFVLLGLGKELQPTGQVGTWSLPLPPYPPPSNLCFAGPWQRATANWPGGYLEFTWWRPPPPPSWSLSCWALAQSYTYCCWSDRGTVVIDQLQTW